MIHALHELSDKKLYIDSLNRMKQMSDEIYARTDLSASQKDDELVRLAYNESRELTKKQLQNPQFSDIMQSPYAEAVVRGCCNGHVLCLIGDPRGQKQGVEKVVAQQDVEKKQQDSGKAQQDVEKKQQDVASNREDSVEKHSNRGRAHGLFGDGAPSVDKKSNAMSQDMPQIGGAIDPRRSFSENRVYKKKGSSISRTQA